MKKLIIMLLLPVLFCGSINAQDRKFRPAIIVKTDGTKIECVAKYPKDFDAKNIEYKVDADSRKNLKFNSDSIRKILYYLDNDRWVEFDHYPVKSFKSLWKDRKKIDEPLFLNVASRGTVTLYKNPHHRDGDRIISNYYCMRAGEDFVSGLAQGYGFYFSSFNKVAGDYFADSPELAEKIRNGENGYKIQNIETIVEEYNAGKAVE